MEGVGKPPVFGVHYALCRSMIIILCLLNVGF